MIESFATVSELRRASATNNLREAYPPVPKALNPPLSSKPKTDGMDGLESRAGYSGDLVKNVIVEHGETPQAFGTKADEDGRDWDRIWPKK